MKKQVKKQLKMSKSERLLYTVAVFLLLASPISIVFSKATLAKVNFEDVESMQYFQRMLSYFL